MDRMNWIRTLLWLLLVVVVSIVGKSFWDDYSFQILTIVVFVTAGATIELWQRAARRPEKLKKKFLKRIFDTKPITPKHEPPPREVETPGVFGKKAKTELMQFFNDFEDFANVVNWWLAEEYNQRPWRLQELPKVDLSLHGDFTHGPRYGRSYAIFHNQERLGALEISPGLKYSAESPQIITHVELESVRVLPFDTIRTFLTDIALHTCDFDRGTEEYFQAQQAIDRAMTEALWQMNQVSRFGLDFVGDDYGEIHLRLDGTATWYVGRRDCEAFQQLKSSIQR
jgi:hypothetical protein